MKQTRSLNRLGGLVVDYHRRDIDGLRAIAILPVLFFHAAFWPFGNGFLGVDIFFVISGYLITGLILRESAAGCFTFADFYDRRIRRIFPALVVLLTVTSVLAFIVYLPDELEWFAKCVAMAALFGSNIFFIYKSMDYFGSFAPDMPLMHVWSLSVEEQFYFVWPLALVLLLRSRWRHRLPQVMAVLAILSLVGAVLLARHYPTSAFYLLPTRAWELLLGGFLASANIRIGRSKQAATAISACGLVLILVAISDVFQTTEAFPTWQAVAATFGTALVLFAGADGPYPIGRLLGSAVPSFIGKISYSLYLWHWPLLIFTRQIMNRDNTPGERVLVLIAAGVLASLSWYFVEQPIRRRRFTLRGTLGRGWPAAIPVGLSVSFFLAAGGLTVWKLHGLPGRMPASIVTYSKDAETDYPVHPCAVARGGVITLNETNCVIGPPQFKDEVLIWADCFGDTLYPGLAGFARDHKVRLRVVSDLGCPPLPGVSRQMKNGVILPECRLHNDSVLQALLKRPPDKIKLVIIDSAWRYLIQVTAITVKPDQPTSRELSRKILVASLESSVRSLSAHGYKVLIMGSSPSFIGTPLHCVGRKIILGVSDAACYRADFEEQAFIDSAIRKIAQRYSGVRTYFPSEQLCHNGECPLFENGHLIYRDTAHLSTTGASIVGEGIRQSLKDWDLDRNESLPK